MHPLMTVVMIFAGGAVAGIAGTMLVLPVLGVVRIIGETISAVATDERIASGNFRRFKSDAVADIFLSPISLCALGDVWKRDSSNEEILKVAFDILIRGLAEGFK